VLLHAGIADRTMWGAHLEPLAAAGLRAVALDLPGFGEAPVDVSGAPEWESVAETMDALSIDHAVLVGNSFGGAMALRTAFVAPERISALVLVSAPPPALEPSAQLQAAWKAEGEAVERGDLDAAVAAVVEAWVLPDAPQALRDRVAAMQRRALELQVGADPEEPPDPLKENLGDLAAIQAPALVLAGERDMPDFLEGAETIAAALPHARHGVIAGAGHLVPLDAPETFREQVLGFLRSQGLI
jgi:pimeloyl-ACP methyl ester carboxylesterase